MPDELSPEQVSAIIVGRTIVGFTDEGSSSDGQGDNTMHIALDDGTTLRFGSWGHDWWGTTLDVCREGTTDAG